MSVSKAELRRIPFVPRWPGAIEGYTINTLRDAYGKLSGGMEFSDLLQEAYIVFVRCKQRYTGPGAENGRFGRVTDPTWFMALYKTALHRRMSTLIIAYRRYSSGVEQGKSDPQTFVGELGNLGELCCLISKLPAEFVETLEQAVMGDTAMLRETATRQLRSWLRRPEVKQLFQD